MEKVIDFGLLNITLRPMRESDVGFQLDYLYRSPVEFLEDIGFDVLKFPGRFEHEKGIKKRLQERGELFQTVVAVIDEQVISVTNLQLEGEPRAHFHILNESLRGKGLGEPILKNSLELLMKRHNITRLWIEPKVSNVPMNKLLEKCKFKFLGESVYSGKTTKEFKSNLYQVERIKSD